MIKLLFFASLRERLGVESEQLALPDSVSDVAGLLEYLRARGGVWDDVMGIDQPILTAINHDMARPDSRLEDGDEVGFFPPVTGG